MVFSNERNLLNEPPDRGRTVPLRFQTAVALFLAIVVQLLAGVSQAAQPPSAGQDGLFNKQGEIQGGQRFWIIKDGKPILSITAGELQELERKARESEDLPTVLAGGAISVEVGEHSGLVQARFSTESQTVFNSVRRFDLQLRNFHITEAPKFTVEQGDSNGVENQLVTTEDGYRWLHHSPAVGKHSVQLVGKCLVNQSSDRRALNLDLPMIGSLVEVHLPPNAVEERLRAEDLLESKSTDEKGVHLKIRTRGGNFSLSWRLASAQAQFAAVEAKCNTLYEPTDLLDPAQFWSATTTLTVRWFGSQATDKIQIALPAGAQWSQLPYSEPDRFRITSMMPQAAAASDTEPAIEVLEIENLDSTEYPSIENLKLQWRWLPRDLKVDRFSAQMTLPVPRLVGVDSHDGNIELVFPNAFQVNYHEGQGTRFVQQGRVANLVGRQQIQFQYKGSDASLQLTFRKEQFQPVIQPIYHVHVRENRIELSGWIKCTFDSKASELGLIPGNWKLEEDLSCKLLDATSPNSAETESLLTQRLEDGSFVFRSRDSDGDEEDRQVEQTWRFIAWQEYDAQSGVVEFQLPQIDRGRSLGQKIVDQGSGTLLVTSENFLLLQADESKLRGLLRGNFSNQLADYVGSTTRQPLTYRFQRLGELPLWRGQSKPLQRHVDVSQMAEIEVGANRILTKQDFKLSITNRALSDVQVSIRSDATPVRANVAGYVLSLVPLSVAQPAAASSETSWLNYRLEGLPELLGDAQLNIVTSIPLILPTAQNNSDESNNPVAVQVPLAKLVLADPYLTDTIRWSVDTNAPIDVKPVAANRSIDNRFELDSRESVIELEIKGRQQSNSVGVVTKGIWVQTLMNGTDRRDRFVARVSSPTKQISIQLPEQAQLDFRVAIDGRQLSSDLAPYDYSLHQAQISLPDDQVHTVEVFYTLTEPLSWATSLEIVPAKVVDSTAHEKYFWQLVTPNIFHLGWCPQSLSAEWQWQWDTVSWKRSSDLEQTNLEQQFAAANLPRLPLGTNSYVMSGYDAFPTVNVWILSRFILWLPIGAMAILITTMALNIAAFRTPTSFVFLCAAIIAVALLWPDLSLLLGQTAIASIGLVMLIWITQAAVQTKVRRRSVFTTRPITNTEMSDHQHTGTRSARSQGSADRPSGVGVE